MRSNNGPDWRHFKRSPPLPGARFTVFTVGSGANMGAQGGVMGAGDRLHRIGAVIYWSKSRYGGTSLRNTNTAVDQNLNT